MSSVKNVGAFEKLVVLCSGNGESYQPGSPNLQLKTMTGLLSQARQSLQSERLARTDFENATNRREAAFSTVGKLSTRILAALIASGAMPQTVDDARMMVRKLSSRRTPEQEPEEAEGEATTTTSRRARGRDFISKVGHLAKLVSTLRAEAMYAPNEKDLQVESLSQRVSQLRMLNSNVAKARTVLHQVRIKRNEVLYTGKMNVFTTARAVKAYIKSVFGYDSNQFEAVSRIRFTNPIR